MDYVLSDCVSLADFIEDNFDTFVHEYNNGLEDESMILNTTYIEARKNVTNVTDYSHPVYFDLDAYGWNLWSEGFITFLQLRNYTY